MARNSSGVYSLPGGINPVVTGTFITANWGNTTMQDVEAALTESLSRNGQGGMLAALKLVNGTAAAPGLSFSASTSTGVYRAAAGELNFAVDAAEIFRLNTTQQLGLAGTAALPAISFIGDPDTGVYSSAANVLGFATNGIVRALLSNTAFTLQSGVIFTGDGSGLTALAAANLTGTLPALSGVNLTALNASNLGSGTVPDARFPATLPAVSGVNLTALNASNLGSGTVPNARFPATLPAASAANLTSIPAGQLTGDVPKAQMATNLNASGSAPFYVVRAWCVLNGTGTPALTSSSSNMSAPTDNGNGDYTLNFTALPTADYAVVFSNAINVAAGAPQRNVTGIRNPNNVSAPTLKSTTQLRICVQDEDSQEDNFTVCVAIIC